MDGLVTEEVKNTISVGLDLNKLIKNNNKNNENPENAQMSFDKLVSDFVPNYDNKFGVNNLENGVEFYFELDMKKVGQA